MAHIILDVSNVQGSIDFSRVKRSGISGVFLKASEGESFQDPDFHYFRKNANAAGLHVGYYHFARPDHHIHPDGEVANFVHQVGKVGPQDLRPVLDFETRSSLLNDGQMVAWARLFNQEVKKSLGVLPLFYTYGAFDPVHIARTPIGAGLWLASYSRNDGKEHPYSVPAPWKKAVAHQFSSNCTVAGCSGRVDLSSAASLTPLLAHPIRNIVKPLPYRGPH